MNCEPISVCAVGAELGEGPLWRPDEAALWFVDIKGQRLHRFDPASGSLRSWPAPAPCGWVLPADDDGLLVGLKGSVRRFDPADGRFIELFPVEPELPDNRNNDATVDPQGRLWFGTMDDREEESTGRLYRWTGGKPVDSGLPPVTVTNGPAISPDGGTLYHTDTLGRAIWAAPLHDDGSLGEPRPFVTIEEGDGLPDGPTVDAEGFLWTGLFGGWAVRRYAPDGRLDRVVRFPVANITKIAFGGERLATAYATTARMGLDAAARERQPLAGDLFAFEPGVAGLPTPPVRLEN